jgi:hypothetical protein
VQDIKDPCVEILPLGPVPEEYKLDPSILGKTPAPAAPKGKRKRPSTIKSDICDMFSMPLFGERKNSVCTECFFRGHISTSTTICPKFSLLKAIEKNKRGKSWRYEIHKYIHNREQLMVLASHMKQLGDVRHSKIENVVAQYDFMANGNPNHALGF